MSTRRPWLLPLVPLYAAGLRLKERRLPEAKRLSFPVISIGSISAGGAGKTPMTLLLLDLLRQLEFAPVVLSRGYRREGTGVERVEARELRNGSAAYFGDEPVLLARRGRAPVYVGDQRYEAGLLAENGAAPNTIFVLDDGFQHRQLARTVDIVLLTKQDVEDHLIPAGNLREPFAALRRADVIVLREEEATALQPLLKKWSDSTVWVVRRSLHFATTPPAKPFAFSGIARPEGFIAMLAAAGCKPAGHTFFGDHHVYQAGDLDRIIKAARRNHAASLVTTEKDAVRLTIEMRGQLESAFPLAVAELRLELLDQAAAVTGLLQQLR